MAIPSRAACMPAPNTAGPAAEEPQPGSCQCTRRRANSGRAKEKGAASRPRPFFFEKSRRTYSLTASTAPSAASTASPAASTASPAASVASSAAPSMASPAASAFASMSAAAASTTSVASSAVSLQADRVRAAPAAAAARMILRMNSIPYTAIGLDRMVTLDPEPTATADLLPNYCHNCDSAREIWRQCGKGFAGRSNSANSVPRSSKPQDLRKIGC